MLLFPGTEDGEEKGDQTIEMFENFSVQVALILWAVTANPKRMLAWISRVQEAYSFQLRPSILTDESNRFPVRFKRIQVFGKLTGNSGGLASGLDG